MAPILDARDRGYIIRTHRLSDTSLIVEWLTQTQGRVATVARGALRKKSPFLGKLDLLFWATLSYRPSQRSDLHQLKEVSLLSTPTRVRRSIHRLNQIAYFIDLIRRTTETDSPLPEIYALFHDAMTMAEAQALGPYFVLWFEWQLLVHLGQQPDLSNTRLSEASHTLLESWSQNPIPETQSVASETANSEIGSLLGQVWIQEWGRCPRLRGTVLTPRL